MYVHTHMCVTCMEVKRQLWKLVSSFHYVDPGGQTEATRLGGEFLYLQSRRSHQALWIC